MTTPWTLTHILAATDLTPSSLPALRYARRLADAFDAKVTVLYSDPILYPMDIVGPSQAMFMMPPAEDDSRLRGELVAHVAQVMNGRQYEIEVTMGHPVAAILKTAEERRCDLIVTGAHLREAWKRLFVGSVSDSVQHESRCPVLVAGDHGDDRPITNILCPVNFTDVARGALDAALRLAQTFRAQLVIVHVVEADDLTPAVEGEATVRRWIPPGLQQMCSYRQIVLRGGAAERVLDCAEDIGANLMVIGARHKLLHNASVAGATTERIIHFASCPVLVIPRVPVSKDVTDEDQRKRSGGDGRRRAAGRPPAV